MSRIEAIQICPVKGEPMVALAEVRVFAGRGLEGDRYFKRAGTYSGKLGVGRELH